MHSSQAARPSTKVVDLGTHPRAELAWVETLGSRARTGPIGNRVSPIVDDIVAEIGDGSWNRAAILIDHFMEVAARAFTSYTYGRWLRCDSWLVDHGVSADELGTVQARLRAQLASADGDFDAGASWDRLGAMAGTVASRMRAGRYTAAEAEDEAERLLRLWTELHDRCLDYIRGIFAFVVARFGEAALGDCMRSMLSGTTRPPEDPTVTLEYVIAAMSGHQSGPGRRGSVALREFDDRWELEFAPCGTGGRSFLANGSASLNPPAVAVDASDKLRGTYDWAWNTAGVCHYCAHCALGLQLMPIENDGRPLVSVEPPTWDFQREAPASSLCHLTIYKEPDVIPDAAYERVGQPRPGAG